MASKNISQQIPLIGSGSNSLRAALWRMVSGLYLRDLKNLEGYQNFQVELIKFTALPQLYRYRVDSMDTVSKKPEGRKHRTDK